MQSVLYMHAVRQFQSSVKLGTPHCMHVSSHIELSKKSSEGGQISEEGMVYICMYTLILKNSLVTLLGLAPRHSQHLDHYADTISPARGRGGGVMQCTMHGGVNL